MMTSHEHCGVLLVGHGTRDTTGREEFAEVVRAVADQLRPTAVEAAFLELAEPSIAVGLSQLYERGVRQLTVAPLLLFAAGHARQDIPAAVAQAAAAFPDLTWRQAEPLGCHPALLDLSAERFRQACETTGHDPQNCRLVMVGRGSHDPEATRETTRYAELLAAKLELSEVPVAFLAMAEPRLAEMLAQVAETGAATVIVQPHLLFHGELLGRLAQEVADWQTRCGTTSRWIVARHLGPDSRVVTAAIARVMEAG